MEIENELTFGIIDEFGGVELSKPIPRIREYAMFEAQSLITPKIGDPLTFCDVKYTISAVKPTTIEKDEYGRPVSWPGFSITAYTKPKP